MKYPQANHDTAFDLSVGPPERSIAEVHALLAADPGAHGFERCPSLRTLEQWSKSDDWRGRRLSIRREAREQEHAEYVQRRVERQERLRQEGLVLQQQGVAWLAGKGADDVRAGEAVRAVVEGVRLEAQGLDDDVSELAIRQRYQGFMEELSDDELDTLVQVLRTTAGTGAPGAGAPPSG